MALVLSIQKKLNISIVIAEMEDYFKDKYMDAV